MPIVESGSFNMFATSSNPDDSIRGAVKSVGRNILDSDSFETIINKLTPADAKFFSPRYAKVSNANDIRSSISSSEQFREFPHLDCPLGIDVTEVNNPNSFNVELEAIFLTSISSGSISSGSGGGLVKDRYFNFEVPINTIITSTADPATNSTFLGWGTDNGTNSIFTSSLSLTFEVSSSVDYYAFFNNLEINSATFCSHSLLAPAFDVCFSCASSSISYGPVTIYYTGSQSILTGAAGDTVWYLDESLSVSASDGRYYPDGGEGSGVFYQVENGVVTQIITCPNGNTLNC
jgi:hypothetical protein